MTPNKTVTITFEFVPEDISPASLARMGERMALEANPPELNPCPAAWARAGISVNQMLRFADNGRMDLALLLCLVAGNSDPAHDDTTPARTRIIGEHKSVTESDR